MEKLSRIRGSGEFKMKSLSEYKKAEVMCEANKGRSKFAQLFLQYALPERSTLEISSSGVFANQINDRSTLGDEEFFKNFGAVYQEAFGRGAISYEEFKALSERDRRKMGLVFNRLQGVQKKNRAAFLEKNFLRDDVFQQPSIQTAVHDDGRLLVPLSDRVDVELRRLYSVAGVTPNIYEGFGYFPDPICARSYPEYESILRRMQESAHEFVKEFTQAA